MKRLTCLIPTQINRRAPPGTPGMGAHSFGAEWGASNGMYKSAAQRQRRVRRRSESIGRRCVFLLLIGTAIVAVHNGDIYKGLRVVRRRLFPSTTAQTCNQLSPATSSL
jgi:hypothetical protein